MTVMYCELCERPVEARRRIGGWTHLFGFLTIGVTYLAVPFYRKRCPICRSKAVTKMTSRDLSRLTRGPSKAELENRLITAVEDLDATVTELDRVREQRDFYKDLRGKGNSTKHG